MNQNGLISSKRLWGMRRFLRKLLSSKQLRIDELGWRCWREPSFRLDAPLIRNHLWQFSLGSQSTLWTKQGGIKLTKPLIMPSFTRDLSKSRLSWTRLWNKLDPKLNRIQYSNMTSWRTNKTSLRSLMPVSSAECSAGAKSKPGDRNS